MGAACSALEACCCMKCCCCCIPGSVPSSLSKITPAFMTKLLQDEGHLTKEQTVTKVESPKDPTIGVGMLSVVSPISMEFSAGVTLPKNVIIKLAVDDVGTRIVGKLFNFFTCEINFFRHLAKDIPIRTPKLYGARYHAPSANMVLLMERFDSDYYQIKLADGVNSLATARLAVRQLAEMHKVYSTRVPELRKLPWLNSAEPGPVTTMILDEYKKGLPLFPKATKAITGKELPAVCMRVAKAFYSADVEEWMLMKGDCLPITLMHGDYHSENLFFSKTEKEDGTPTDFGLIDFQLCALGPGLNDFAFFLVTSFTTERRRQVQEELLQLYAEVHGISIETAWLGYRLGVICSMRSFILGCQPLLDAYKGYSEDELHINRERFNRLIASFEDLQLEEAMVWFLDTKKSDGKDASYKRMLPSPLISDNTSNPDDVAVEEKADA